MSDEALVAAAALLLGDAETEGVFDTPVVAFQRCSRCGYLRYPAGAFCPECLGGVFEWQPDTGEGTVWSFCIYHRAFDHAFDDALPYNVVLVELDSGPRLVSNVLGLSAEAPRIGMRVVAEPRRMPDGRFLVYFAPIVAEGAS